MFLDRGAALLAGALVTLSAGCSSDPPDGTGGAGGTGAAGAPAQGPAVSQKANVRFKRGERLRNDIAQALDLAPNEVCNELGKFSCADVVHTVALGGVDPYATGLFEPPADTAASTPLAVDRMVLSACIERAKRDLADPASAVVFQKLSIDAAGKLSDPGSAAVGESIDRLYKRALTRPATSAEIASLSGFYSKVEAKAQKDPARQWATLACYAALTTTEFLFY